MLSGTSSFTRSIQNWNYYTVRRAGWHPFWDRLWPIFNPDSDLIRNGGFEEPEYTDFVPPADGFRYANELIEYIVERSRESGTPAPSIGAACCPEVHPEAPDAETDLRNLARKVDAGATFLISQLFLDNAKFFDFVERARGIGIEVPIVPGIMPIATVSGIRRMAGMNGSSFPPELEAELDRVDGDDAATYALGVRWARAQCEELLAHGVPGIHFYTLNRSPATREIYGSLFGG